MRRARMSLVWMAVVACVIGSVVVGATPAGDAEQQLENSYYLYTSRYKISDSGVVALPSHVQWSVETSWRGPGMADNRIMLRLHDHQAQFSAMTAQMDLATAAKLHHELGEILVKKLQDPHYQNLGSLGRPQELPTKTVIGVDENGTAIMQDVPD